MPLKIKDKPITEFSDKFVIYRTWMHGDADAYTKDHLSYSSKDQDFVEEMYKLHKKMHKKRFEDNSEYYDLVSKFPKVKDKIVEEFFDDSSIVSERDIIEDCFVDFADISSDATSDHQYRAKLDEISIFYFDKKGQKFKVDVS